MRLFKASIGYKSLILSVAKYMGTVTKKKFSDYSTPQGISGANIGVPLNIVGVKLTESAAKVCCGHVGEMFFMLNPKVLYQSPETVITKSNCGSIRLPEKIEVKRHKEIEISYYDISGKENRGKFHGVFACTLAHEIDHNLGILITDNGDK